MRTLLRSLIQGVSAGAVIGAMLLWAGHMRPVQAENAVTTVAVPAPAGAATDTPAAAPGTTVRAQRFELVDADGKVRGIFGIQADKTVGLTVQTADGKPLITLAASGTNIPAVTLTDAQGNKRAAMCIKDDGSVAISTNDAKGNVRTTLTVDKSDRPHVALQDPDGTVREDLNVDKAKDSALNFLDVAGKTRLSVGMDKDNEPFTVLYDAYGKTRFDVGLWNTGLCALDMHDTNGNSMQTLEIGSDNKPHLFVNTNLELASYISSQAHAAVSSGSSASHSSKGSSTARK